jgi:metacaspase-1
MANKAALLIGINYIMDSQNRLNGCCNDVVNMANMLIGKFGFLKEKVSVYADTSIKYVPSTTREAILIKLYEFALRSWQEDLTTAYFHFSGHGTQVPDLNNDEADGLDEGICPSDFGANGIITDDLLYKVFASFNPKTTIIAVFDCCHSGSILDLPWTYNELIGRSQGRVDGTTTLKLKTPRLIMLSGCMDPQTSDDAFNTDTKQYGGALSMCLAKALTDGQPLDIKKVYSRVVAYVKKGEYVQRPLLSSSMPITDEMMFL